MVKKVSMVIDKDDLKADESRRKIAERFLRCLDEVAATAVVPVQIDVYPVKVNKYYRTGEVAEAFQVSDRMVRKWCEQGKIPALQTPGGGWRILASQLADLSKVKMLQETARKINKRFQGLPEIDEFER